MQFDFDSAQWLKKPSAGPLKIQGIFLRSACITFLQQSSFSRC